MAPTMATTITTAATMAPPMASVRRRNIACSTVYVLLLWPLLPHPLPDAGRGARTRPKRQKRPGVWFPLPGGEGVRGRGSLMHVAGACHPNIGATLEAQREYWNRYTRYRS